MEVEVWHQMGLAERVDSRCKALWDMPVAKCLANHDTVFCFDQTVVIAVSRPRFGEFDVQFIEQRSDLMIDIFRPVVGMKAKDLERKLRQHGFDHRQQISFADFLMELLAI